MRLEELGVLFHRGFIGGEQEIEDLQAVGIDEVFLSLEDDFQAHLHPFMFTQIVI